MLFSSTFQAFSQFFTLLNISIRKKLNFNGLIPTRDLRESMVLSLKLTKYCEFMMRKCAKTTICEALFLSLKNVFRRNFFLPCWNICNMHRVWSYHTRIEMKQAKNNEQVTLNMPTAYIPTF